MLEVKTVGRGGQGAVTFSQILAIAAFEEGYPVVQAMPSFGVERRGAPSYSYTRLSKTACTGYRSLIYNPEMVVILDASLVKDINVTEGMKKNGIIIINSKKTPAQLGIKGFKAYTVDATEVALRIFKKDIVNTAMLGAFAAVLDDISLESFYKGIEQKFGNRRNLIESNKEAIKEVYERVKKDL